MRHRLNAMPESHVGVVLQCKRLLRTSEQALELQPQSSGSTLTRAAPWLLPTQNVTGVVELSTNTVRMLVSRGSRYSTVSPVLGSSLTARSVCMPPVHISPFLSMAARYG